MKSVGENNLHGKKKHHVQWRNITRSAGPCRYMDAGKSLWDMYRPASIEDQFEIVLAVSGSSRIPSFSSLLLASSRAQVCML